MDKQDELVRDIALLPDLAEAHYDEWDVMRHMLQFYDELDDARLDAFIDEIAAPIVAAIDCKQCANCCRTLPVEVRLEDAQRLAAALHMSLEDFVARYLGPHPDGDAWLMHRDGTAQSPLVTGSGGQSAEAWLPDGRILIADYSSAEPRWYLLSADGSRIVSSGLSLSGSTSTPQRRW